MPNKFFDVEITGNNPRLITGRLVPRADLEDYWKNEVARIIEGLNLNQEALKNARKDTFHNAVLTVKNKGAKSWEHVFEYYNSKPRAYQEFILLSIAKQV